MIINGIGICYVKCLCVVPFARSVSNLYSLGCSVTEMKCTKKEIHSETMDKKSTHTHLGAEMKIQIYCTVF